MVGSGRPGLTATSVMHGIVILITSSLRIARRGMHCPTDPFTLTPIGDSHERSQNLACCVRIPAYRGTT